MDLRLGETLTNQKGGKFLPTEPPLRWNTTQWAEILYKPSSFGKCESERVSLVLELTAEMEKTVERLEKAGLQPGRRQEAGGAAAVQRQADSQRAEPEAESQHVQGPLLGRRRQQTDQPAGRAQRLQGVGRGRAAAAVDHEANVRPSCKTLRLQSVPCKPAAQDIEGRLLTASLEIFRRFCETVLSRISLMNLAGLMRRSFFFR